MNSVSPKIPMHIGVCPSAPFFKDGLYVAARMLKFQRMLIDSTRQYVTENAINFPEPSTPDSRLILIHPDRRTLSLLFSAVSISYKVHINSLTFPYQVLPYKCGEAVVMGEAPHYTLPRLTHSFADVFHTVEAKVDSFKNSYPRWSEGFHADPSAYHLIAREVTQVIPGIMAAYHRLSLDVADRWNLDMWFGNQPELDAEVDQVALEHLLQIVASHGCLPEEFSLEDIAEIDPTNPPSVIRGKGFRR